MLGRQRHRLAQAQGEGVEDPGLSGPAFGLVGDKDHRPPAPAQDLGEDPVVRGHALPRVDDEQRQVGLVDRLLGLRLHPGFEALVVDVLETGGVDQL